MGPGSLLWSIASDWRSMLPGPSAGLMQLMYPPLGAGVEQHSAFFSEPWDRILRSIPQIWATIFADDGDERARSIRDLHRDIKGVDGTGRPYHALQPETFWWAHATFTWEMFRTAEIWDQRSLSPRHREQLYAETVEWYRRYGVSDRVVPPTLHEFEARFEQICEEELTLTPSAAKALELALAGRAAIRDLPAPVTFILTPPMRLATIGSLPSTVRRRFDIPWSRADRVEFAALVTAVRQAGIVIPHWLQRGPFLASIKRMKSPRRARPAA